MGSAVQGFRLRGQCRTWGLSTQTPGPAAPAGHRGQSTPLLTSVFFLLHGKASHGLEGPLRTWLYDSNPLP